MQIFTMGISKFRSFELEFILFGSSQEDVFENVRTFMIYKKIGFIM